MPNICISVTDLDLDDNGNIKVLGRTIVEDEEGASEWSATFSWTAIPSAVNSAIVAAAVGEAENYFDITIGLLDNKTLLGGAVGLL